MAEELKTSSRRPRRVLRWAGIAFAVLILLLVAVWFVGTSEWALKTIILPRVSKAVNATITVEGARLAPFSAVDLRGLQVQTTGTEPVLAAREVRVRYSLRDILKENFNVREIVLEAPVVNHITFPDGTSNLDPITQSGEPRPDRKPREPGQKEEPARLHLQRLVLNNGTVRKITQREDGTRELLELTGLNITAEDIGNNQTGQIELASLVRFDQGLNAATNGVLAAKLGGRMNLVLDSELKPQVAKGQTRVDVTDARGAFADAAELGIVVNTDLTPTQLNDVSVRFSQRGTNLGAITVSGPFNPEATEGRLNVVVSQIDRQVLNLAGAAMGIDFNQTTVNSTNVVELKERGRIISVNGALLVSDFSATQNAQTTPVLDLRTEYGLVYDQTNQTALVQQFALAGTQNNEPLVRGVLARPMLLSLGDAAAAVDESAFNLVITNFNLPDWQAFLGTNATISSGRLAMTLNLVSQQAGKRLTLDLATRLRDLTAVAGSNRIENADIAFTSRGVVSDFSAVHLDQYRAELARDGHQALVASGALQYNTQTQDADVQADLETSLPAITQLVEVPGLRASSGVVKFAGRVVQKNTTPQQTNNPVLDRSIAGRLNVEALTGAFGSNHFDRFTSAIDLDVTTRNDLVDIRRFNGSIQQSGQPGGAFEVAGRYHLTNETGQITARLIDLNQHALRSFVAAALGDKQLESVTINATTTAKLDGPADRAIKAELRVANLVVNDPSGQVPRTPLAIDAVADVAQARGVMDLRQVQLALTKTERAPNAVNVSGRIDMTQSNAWSGNVKVTSDGLDVTPYYEIFAGNKPTQEGTQPPPTDRRPPVAIQPEPSPERDPEPMTLPFGQFTLEMNIAKFFLREVAISNLAMRTSFDQSRVRVDPLSLTLNGAPAEMSALVNVGVPGWQYELNTKLDGVPVEPLANTFVPEQSGIYKGNLFASANIKGIGTTGRSLQQHLGGQAGFTLTNAEIRYADARFENRYIKWLVMWAPYVSTYLRVPELADSPISWMDSQFEIRDGTVTLTRTMLESPAFQAGVNGTLTLRPILTNSVLNKLPLQLALRRSLAERARLVAGGGDTPYVSLPSFVSIEGTVGRPRYDINEAGLARILAGAAGGLIRGDAGRILRGIGNLGEGGSNTNQPGTNAAPATGLGNLIRGVEGLLQVPRTNDTNTAKTNAPAQGNRFRLNDLLR